MRGFVVGLAAIGWFAAITLGAADAEVRGTARTGERPQPNAVVWLEAPRAPSSPRTTRVVLDQRNITFSPHVLAVRVGTTVEFPNNDRVFHNVFSFRDGKRFDLGMYPVGTMRPVRFDQPGISRLFCNIHPNMAAYVIALDTPYFGVAGKSGAFTIPAVPPGSYDFKAWHPTGSTIDGVFNSDAGEALEIRWP